MPMTTRKSTAGRPPRRRRARPAGRPAHREGEAVRTRSLCAIVALICVLAAIGLAAGCGGDDTPASPQGATVTGQASTAAATVAAPTDVEIEEAVRLYQEVFGFTEEEARCILTKTAELSEGGAAADLAAADPTTGQRILRECGIDPATVSSRLGEGP